MSAQAAASLRTDRRGPAAARDPAARHGAPHDHAPLGETRPPARDARVYSAASASCLSASRADSASPIA